MARTEIIAGALVRSRFRSFIWELGLDADEVRSLGRTHFFVTGPQDKIDYLNERVQRHIEESLAREEEAAWERHEAWRNRWYAPWRRRSATR